MPIPLTHDLQLDATRDEHAAQDFVVGLRRFVLDDLAQSMRTEYESKVAPKLERTLGADQIDQDVIHKSMRSNSVFQVYSATRYNAQELVWRSVIPTIADQMPALEAKADQHAKAPQGSLTLHDGLAIPANVAKLDVHLMPGGYISDAKMLSGSLYDNGLRVFAAGMIGPDLDDIGQSFARYIAHTMPDLKPKRIVDAGCTLGHHTVPWAQVFPEAQVHGIDVSASMLAYGHARAESLAVPVHFEQMNATQMTFEDASIDIIFSSQFLHEMSLKDTAKFFAEAHRVLKPGGLLVTMELPPNKALAAYDQFYLDWDSYYNCEPFYRAFRDADMAKLVAGTGFDMDSYFHFTIPQYFTMSDDEFANDLADNNRFDDKLGRMSSEFRYFGFGFRK